MEYVAIEKAEYEQLLNSVKKTVTDIRTIAEECSINSEWIENDELSRLLSLSKHQLKGYRGRGLLGYTMIGNKIYYKRREVERFIKRHINK